MLGRLMVYHLLFVNIAWAFLNLLPVQPLDGGQIVLEGLKAFGVSAADQIASLFGLLIAGVVAVWAYQHQETYLMFLFGVLCVGCYQRLVSKWFSGLKETLAVHRDSESIAHREERTLVVALGASNLSRGLSRLLQASRCCSSSAVDLVVAAGHGRSYGANSRIWKRRLPSIL